MYLKAAHNNSLAFHFIFMSGFTLKCLSANAQKHEGALPETTLGRLICDACSLAHQRMPCESKYINKLFVIEGLGAMSLYEL